MSSARWRASDVAELITRGRYAQRAVDQLLAAPPPRSGRRYVAGSMNGLERRYAEELTLRLAAGDITWWAFEAVKRGWITSTRTLTPYGEIQKSVEALAAAWAGKPAPRFVPLATQFITKANVDKFKPEY